MEVQVSDIAGKFHNQLSPVREIMNFAEKATLQKLGINFHDFISFGGGWVNHSSPEAYRDAYLDILNDNEKFHFSGGYSPTPGELFCKEAVISFEEALFGLSGLKTNEVFIGQSSTQLTYLLFKILVNEHDKIMFLDPTYCNYALQNNIFNAGNLISFPVIDATTFRYIANEPQTVSRLRKFIASEKPKVVFLVSPDNPTGQVLSDEFVNAAYEEVQKYGGVVIIDFSYKTFVFGNNPQYFSQKPDGNFITIHSNSKWGRNLGKRLGWIEAPSYILEHIVTFQSATILCPDRLHQMAFTEYVNRSVKDGSLLEFISATKDLYQKAAQFTAEQIDDHLGLPYIKPAGGIYTCVKVSKNSALFIQDVLKNTAVLFIPGWGFGNSLKDAVRLSFGPLVHDHYLIARGLKRVGEYLKSYGN